MPANDYDRQLMRGNGSAQLCFPGFAAKELPVCGSSRNATSRTEERKGRIVPGAISMHDSLPGPARHGYFPAPPRTVDSAIAGGILFPEGLYDSADPDQLDVGSDIILRGGLFLRSLAGHSPLPSQLTAPPLPLPLKRTISWPVLFSRILPHPNSGPISYFNPYYRPASCWISNNIVPWILYLAPQMSSLPLPCVTGHSTKPISILLINPNGTTSMTLACLRSLEDTLPPGVMVSGFTAPHPAPSAIEGHLDGVLSAAAAVRDISLTGQNYDAYLVACFSAHPLINALREEVAGPVIGIMEAALYSARILGGRLGIVATGGRSKIMHEDAIRYYGLDGFSVGCETTNLGVLELERLPRDKVLGLVSDAARRLVQEKGADCIVLGCAGMTDMKSRCEEAVDSKNAVTQVIDGVGVGIHILIGLVRESHVTAKGGIFRSAQVGRQARGQDWL